MTWDENNGGRAFGAGRGIAPPQDNRNGFGERPGGNKGFDSSQSGRDNDGGGGFGGGRRGDRENGGGFGGRREGGGGGGFGGGRRGGDDEDGGRRGGGGFGGGGGGGGFGGGGRRGGDDEDGGGRRGGFGGGRRGGDDEDGGGRRGGFGGGRRGGDDEDGGRRGGGGGFGGGGGGFGGGGRRGGDDEDGGGRRGGFGGGRRGGDDEEGGRRGGGGFGGGGGGGGFGGGGRRGGDDEDGGGRRGGFGGGRRGGDDDEDGGGRRGGFGGGRRGGDDDEEGGGRRGGFGGGRRGGDGDDEEGGRGGGRRGGDGDNADGEQKPRSTYVPPEPSNDEAVLFGSGIGSGINFDKYDSIEVKCSGSMVPEPITCFEDAGLRDHLLNNVRKSGYVKPTPVQKYAIPIVMGGRDLMACAQTGSGKTAGFLLPIINRILADPELVTDSSHTEPHAVIVAPTRELVLQIFEEARKFSLGSTCSVAVAYGGTSCYAQAQKVAKGCHILVATPGRLHDFVGRGRITFSSVRFVVLDEGDRMLDMGFLPEVEKLFDHPSMTPAGSRQTLLFSATFPEDVQELAKRFLQDYIFLAVGIVGGACSDIEQEFYEVTKFDKRSKLEEVLRKDNSGGTMVFVETKRNADFIAALLSQKGFPTTSIHGDREQKEREEALRDFKSGKMKVLVATAVAARGLDIKNVAHVVNFDLPKSVDEFVHRIGRTGRVGNKGRATSFYDPESDSNLAPQLVTVLTGAKQSVPEFLKSAGGGGGDYGSSNFGGQDVRRSQGGGFSSNQPEEEESWD